MSAEIEREREKVIQEWKQKAKDDLESAEVLLRETDNYEIAAYHAHQAIEKILKAELMERGETFKFIHDLNTLFQQVFGAVGRPDLFEKISFVNSLYPMLRYPTGDKVARDQAEKCIEAVKVVFAELNR